MGIKTNEERMKPPSHMERIGENGAIRYCLRGEMDAAHHIPVSRRGSHPSDGFTPSRPDGEEREVISRGH